MTGRRIVPPMEMPDATAIQEREADEFLVRPATSPRRHRAHDKSPASVLLAGTLALGIVWLIGQIARDATWLTGLCFYIPTPVVAGALVGWALCKVIRRQFHAAALAAVLALLPLGVILFAENHFTVTPERPGSGSRMRLVHWNVEGALSPATQEVLRSQQADLYVLSEIPDASAVAEFRATLGPEY